MYRVALSVRCHGSTSNAAPSETARRRCVTDRLPELQIMWLDGGRRRLHGVGQNRGRGDTSKGPVNVTIVMVSPTFWLLSSNTINLHVYMLNTKKQPLNLFVRFFVSRSPTLYYEELWSEQTLALSSTKVFRSQMQSVSTSFLIWWRFPARRGSNLWPSQMVGRCSYEPRRSPIYV